MTDINDAKVEAGMPVAYNPPTRAWTIQLSTKPEIHKVTGYAAEFRDGWAIFHYNGGVLAFPAYTVEWVEGGEEVTQEETA